MSSREFQQQLLLENQKYSWEKLAIDLSPGETYNTDDLLWPLQAEDYAEIRCEGDLVQQHIDCPF